jgi:Sperm-tail PG-rich repeat
MGQDQRADKNFEKAKGTVPGPGNYELESVAFDHKRPRFHMGTKIKLDPIEKERNSVPGPGSFNPSIDFSKSRAPGYSIVGRGGSGFSNLYATPGPGSYNSHKHVIHKEAPSFGFGSSTRKPLDGQKDWVPGPGEYKLPTMISDVPNHVHPNKKDEHKYV